MTDPPTADAMTVVYGDGPDPLATITVVCAHRADRVYCPTGDVTVPAEDGRITDASALEGWARTGDGWLCPWCKAEQ